MDNTAKKGYLNIVTIVSFLFLLGAIFPIFSANTHLPLMWPAFAFMFLFIVFNQPKIIISRPFLIAIAYLVVLITYKSFAYTDETVEFLIGRVHPFVIVTLILMYARLRKDNKYIKSIYLIMGIMILLRCISAIIAELIFPGAARGSGAGVGAEETLSDDMAKIGAGGYTFINALPFIVLPLMYLWKKMKSTRMKVIIISLILLMIYAIAKTSWGTALIFAMMTFIIGFFVNNRRRLLLSTVLLSIMISISFFYSKEIFRGLDDIFSDNPVLLKKINDIQESLDTKQTTGQVQTRSELYDQSFGVFMKNPLWGSNKEIGGHAFFIDHLARYGILGTSFLALLLFSVYRESIKVLPEDFKLSHQTNIFLFVLFGCVKNITGFEFILFLFLFSPFIINYWTVQKANKLKPSFGRLYVRSLN